MILFRADEEQGIVGYDVGHVNRHFIPCSAVDQSGMSRSLNIGIFKTNSSNFSGHKFIFL